MADQGQRSRSVYGTWDLLRWIDSSKEKSRRHSSLIFFCILFEGKNIRSPSFLVGNLPWDVKEEDLRKIFSQVGTIVSLRMPLDPETGNSKGFAFCEFRDQDSTNVAIKHFNGFEMNGRKIRVDSAANNSDKDSKGRGAFATIEVCVDGVNQSINQSIDCFARLMTSDDL